MKHHFIKNLFLLVALFSFLGNGMSQTNCNNTVSTVNYYLNSGSNSFFQITFGQPVRNTPAFPAFSDYYKYYVTKATESAPSNYNDWYNLFDSTSSVNTTIFSVYNNQNNYAFEILPEGDYKLWLVNTRCTVPAVIEKAFSVSGCSYDYMYKFARNLNVQAASSGIKATWLYSPVLSADDYEYQLYKYSDGAPATWIEHSGFYSNSVLLTKDSYGDDLENTDYTFRIRVKTCLDGTSSSRIEERTLSSNYCLSVPQDVQFLPAQHGVSFKFNPAVTAPADGYAYIVHQGGAPSYPTGYTHIGSLTEVHGIDTTYTGAPIFNSSYYLVNIVSVCDSAVFASAPVSNSTFVSFCNQQITDLEVEDHHDGSIDVTWNAPAAYTPDYGYAYALYSVAGVVPTYPNDYTFIDNNTVTSFAADTLYDGASLGFGTYSLNVYAICDSLNNYKGLTSTTFSLNLCGGTPQNLAVSQVDSTLNVSWDLNTVTPADGYAVSVYRLGTSEASPEKWIYVNNTVNAIVIDTTANGNVFQNNKNYVVKVYAVCDSVAAEFSAPADSTVKVTYTCNLVVNNVSVTDLHDGTVDLVWDVVPNAAGYYYALVDSLTGIPVPSGYVYAASNSVSGVAATTDGASVIANNKPYTVYVKAACEATGTLVSAPTTAVFTADNCPVPTNVTFVDNGDDTFTYTWDSLINPNVTGYAYYIDYLQYPSNGYYNNYNYYSHIDTNSFSAWFDTDSLIIEIVSVCGTGISASVAVIDTVDFTAPCWNNYVDNIIVSNAYGTGSINVTANMNQHLIPTQGIAYAVKPDVSGFPSPQFPQDFTFVNDTIITNIAADYTGGTLSDGMDYQIYVYSVCDTATWNYNSNSTYYYYTSCVRMDAYQSDLSVTANNAAGTIDFLINDTLSPAGYFYAVLNDNGPYPVFPQDYTYTTDRLHTNINHYFDGTTFGSTNGGDLYVSLYAVCNLTDTTVSNQIGRYVYLNAPFCNAPSNVQVNYANGAVNVSWNLPQTAPAYGYVYALVPSVYQNSIPQSAWVYVPVNGQNILNTLTITNETVNGAVLEENKTYYLHFGALCDSASFTGDGDDYTINTTVTPPVQCYDAVNSLSVNQNYSTIVAEWDDYMLREDGYAYAVVPAGTTPVAADYVYTYAKNITVSATTNGGSTLLAGQTYNVYVKVVCDLDVAILSADYVAQSITMAAEATTVCEPVYDLTVTDQNNGKLTVSWSYDVNLTDGFLYAIVPAGTTPAAADYKTAYASPLYNVATTTTADSLVSGNAYAVYVQAVCDAANNVKSVVKSKGVTIYNTVGLNVTETTEVKVYPNPTTGELTIEVGQLNETAVSIMDMTGKLVYSSDLNQLTTTVNMRDFTSGVYIVNVKDANNAQSIRVVKK